MSSSAVSPATRVFAPRPNVGPHVTSAQWLFAQPTSRRFSTRWCRKPLASRVHAVKDSDRKASDPDSVTKQYGLEAGIFSAFKSGSGAATAKDLLKRYGSAYLLTSITLAIISFTLCYVAVDAGVDVPSLLTRLGLSVGADSAWDKGGTAALAYAAHKALSPVRFPPTVALTPLIAQRMGKADRGDGSTLDDGDSSPENDKSS